MGCGGCSRKTRPTENNPNTPTYVTGGYKYLTDAQIRARLEIFKRNNCKGCDDYYTCDYAKFSTCEKYKK
jgi:hypothetical protein